MEPGEGGVAQGMPGGGAPKEGDGERQGQEDGEEEASDGDGGGQVTPGGQACQEQDGTEEEKPVEGMVDFEAHAREVRGVFQQVECNGEGQGCGEKGQPEARDGARVGIGRRERGQGGEADDDVEHQPDTGAYPK